MIKIIILKKYHQAFNTMKTKITIILILSAFMSSQAYAKTIVSTRNSYESYTHTNVNRLEIYHSFKNGLNINVFSNIHTNKNMKYKNSGISLGYNYKINQYIKSNIGVEYQFSKNKNKNKISPYSKISILKNNIYSSIKYKYNYLNNKEIINSIDLNAGIYTKKYYLLIDANYLFSNKNLTKTSKGTINYGMNFGVNINHFQPYLEIEKIQINNKTDKKQTRYRIGLKYTF